MTHAANNVSIGAERGLTAPLQKCSIVYVPIPPYAGRAGTERNVESVVFWKRMVQTVLCCFPVHLFLLFCLFLII